MFKMKSFLMIFSRKLAKMVEVSILDSSYHNLAYLYVKNAATADIYIASLLLAYLILAYLHTSILAYRVIRFRIKNAATADIYIAPGL